MVQCHIKVLHYVVHNKYHDIIKRIVAVTGSYDCVCGVQDSVHVKKQFNL